MTLTPTARGVLDAYRSTALLRRLGLRDRIGYVVNRWRPGIDLDEVMADLGGERRGARSPRTPALADAENHHGSPGSTVMAPSPRPSTSWRRASNARRGAGGARGCRDGAATPVEDGGAPAASARRDAAPAAVVAAIALEPLDLTALEPAAQATCVDDHGAAALQPGGAAAVRGAAPPR